nr:MAG TPA_asm: hypothetical protein [Caudoviricetes sp.]
MILLFSYYDVFIIITQGLIFLYHKQKKINPLPDITSWGLLVINNAKVSTSTNIMICQKLLYLYRFFQTKFIRIV